MIRLPLLVALLAASGAAAQTVTADIERTFGPAEPGRKGTTFEYRSVFGQPEREPDETSWKKANDNVGRLGGHAGQLKDKDSGPSSESHAPAASTAPSPHHRH